MDDTDEEHRGNIGNLRPPWKPGQSGNPGGRPKGQSVTARIRKMLEQVEINGKPVGNNRQVADLLCEVILKAALKGDHRFVETVLNRTEGPVRPVDDDVNDSDARTALRGKAIAKVKRKRP